MKVEQATLTGDMGSLGQASNKLIRQFQFPYEYDETVDDLVQADHDRMLTQNYKEFMAICKKHIKTGDVGLGYWITQVSHGEVFAFLTDLFEELCDLREIAWTGYRVTGSVHRGNGNPIYHLWLFAKGTKSKTKVYSGNKAPNVKIPGGMRWNRKDLRNWPGAEM